MRYHRCVLHRSSVSTATVCPWLLATLLLPECDVCKALFLQCHCCICHTLPAGATANIGGPYSGGYAAPGGGCNHRCSVFEPDAARELPSWLQSHTWCWRNTLSALAVRRRECLCLSIDNPSLCSLRLHFEYLEHFDYFFWLSGLSLVPFLFRARSFFDFTFPWSRCSSGFASFLIILDSLFCLAALCGYRPSPNVRYPYSLPNARYQLPTWHPAYLSLDNALVLLYRFLSRFPPIVYQWWMSLSLPFSNQLTPACWCTYRYMVWGLLYRFFGRVTSDYFHCNRTSRD